MVKTKLVPPDGGYGWIIVGAYALHSLIAVPITPGFGLIFKDTFKTCGFSAKDTAIIINVNTAFSMFLGIFNGPLLKQLGYRIVSLCGAALITIGIILTAYSHTFTEYIITHGIITAAGIGLGMSSYPLALNTFFCKERPKAVGYAMTIAGIGPILMPQLISYMLDLYGEIGGVLVLGALAGNTFVSALLLQPAEWHMKRKIIEDDEDPESEKMLLNSETEDYKSSLYDKHEAKSKSKLSFSEEDIQLEAAYGVETPLARSVLSLYDVLNDKTQPVTTRRTPFMRSISMHNEGSNNPGIGLRERSSSLSSRRQRQNSESQDEFSESEAETASINLPIMPRLKKKRKEPKPGTWSVVLEEDEEERSTEDKRSNEDRKSIEAHKANGDKKSNQSQESVGELSKDVAEHKIEMTQYKLDELENPKLSDRIRLRIVDIFDLKLLNDSTYANIAVGMSFAVFSEISMTLFFPFILQDWGLNTHEIATFLSVMSIVDTGFRFMVPYVTAFANQPIRIMYMIANVLLITARFSILFATSYISLLGVAIFLGLAKGFRTVYWTLVIPSYVPIDTLASAIGFQSAFNAIFICLGGPFLGFLRDATGSYVGSIILVNFFTSVMLIMWSAEFIYKYIKYKKTPVDNECYGSK